MQNRSNMENSIENIKSLLLSLNIEEMKQLGELLASHLGFVNLSSMLSAFSGSSSSSSDNDVSSEPVEKTYKVIFKKLKEGQISVAVKKIKDYYKIGLAEARSKTESEFVIIDNCDESTKVAIVQEWSVFADVEEVAL